MRHRLLLVALFVVGASGCAAPRSPVAAPATADLVYLAGPMPAEDLAALRRDAPNLRIVANPSRDEAMRLAPTVNGVDGRFCTPELLRAAPNLQWVQSPSAGVERYVAMPGIRDNDAIVLTNMQGVHGPTIADHAFAMLLALTRDLRHHLDPAHRGTWNRQGSGAERIALSGRTLLVVGLGGIGSEVAQRGKGFGMTVHAIRRSRTPPPPCVDRQETPDKLLALLPEADVVAICLPLTDETEGLFDAEALAAMRPGAFLINVGRGPIVVTDALVRALGEGRLGGACLDVTDPEPLPPDHPLWAFPNVVITPHVSGSSELTQARRREIQLENLRRFGRGEPLLNVVDKRAGY